MQYVALSLTLSLSPSLSLRENEQLQFTEFFAILLIISWMLPGASHALLLLLELI